MEDYDKKYYTGRYRPGPKKVKEGLGRKILAGLKPLTPQKEKELMADQLGLEQLHFSVTVKLFNKDKVRGFADVVINKTIKLNGLTIREGANGLFAGPPSKKGKDGDLDKNGRQKYYPYFNPITKEGYHALQSAVMTAYDATLAKENGDVVGDAQEDAEAIPF